MAVLGKHLRAAIAGALATLCAVPTLRGQQASEYDVKAAFVYNFVKFVEWPEQALAGDASLVIGVLGDEQFRTVLEGAVRGKKRGGRSMEVRALASGAEIAACHVVYIGRNENEKLSSLIEAVREEPILTVGEEEAFVQRGGMIGFLMQDNKVRFSVNTAAASQARLKISSQLVKLAVSVVQ